MLSQNSKIKLSDLDFKRPGTGICPSKVNSIIGKKIKYNVNKDYIFKKTDFK